MSIWMNGKVLMKQHYLIKKNTEELEYRRFRLDADAGADQMHGKRVCKDFETKHLGEYHDLYLKSHAITFG